MFMLTCCLGYTLMMATGRMKPESMITAIIKLDEVEEKGFKTLVNDKDNHVKILVEVSP